MHKTVSIMRLGAPIGLAFAGVLALSACAEKQASEQQGYALADNHAHEPHGATVKPGADVAFTHEFVPSTIVGGPKLVRLTIEEAYASGELELEIIKSDGLKMVQSRKTRINMAAGDRHNWDLRFETPSEGRFYISLMARVGGESGEHRAYSIPVYVGDISKSKPEARGMKLEETPNGERIVTMRAKETIIEE